jgi:hypothetical protein
VISTRRSTRSAGAGATVHSDVRTSRVSGRKSAVAAQEISSRRTRRGRSSSSRRPPRRRCNSSTNARASGVRISSLRSSARPTTWMSDARSSMFYLANLAAPAASCVCAHVASGPLDGCVQSAEESGNAGATTKIGLQDWRNRMLHSAWRKSKPASDRATEGGACGKDRQRRR